MPIDEVDLIGIFATFLDFLSKNVYTDPNSGLGFMPVLSYYLCGRQKYAGISGLVNRKC